MPKTVTDASFEQDVLNSSTPIVVDFWADWCGPCKTIAPHLEKLEEELGDRVQVAKVNVDENPDTPRRYAVRGIPTLMLFKDGELASQKVGAMTKDQLASWVKENV